MSISSIMGNSSLLSSILNPTASGSSSTSATGTTSATGSTSATGTTSSSEAQALQNFLSALTQALQEGAQASAPGATTTSPSAASATQLHHHHHGQTSQTSPTSQGSTSGATPNAFQGTQALGSMISVRA